MWLLPVFICILGCLLGTDGVSARSLQGPSLTRVQVPVGANWLNRAWCPEPQPGMESCQRSSVPYPPANGNAGVLNVDMFDTTKEKIIEYRNMGWTVMCYISAGSYEDWRPDAAQFPQAIKGLKMYGWDELWLDVRSSNPYHNYLRALMQNRIITAANKGCQILEFDNVDSWANDALTGVPRFDPAVGVHQLNYNAWLATTSHQYGLAAALKNDLGQVEDLEPYFDLAVNENCFTYNECDRLSVFTRNGKAVLGTSYKYSDPNAMCISARSSGYSWLLAENSAWTACEQPGAEVISPGNTQPPDDFFYGDWSECSVSCGGGTRQRECVNKEQCSTPEYETCNVQLCPVACDTLSIGPGQVLGDGDSMVWACPTGFEVEGSSTATCIGGFVQPPICKDIDECAIQDFTCSPNAECVNTAGAYRCQCATGYAGNGITCTRKDTLVQSERLAYGQKYLQSSCGHVAAVSQNGHLVMYAGDGVAYFSSQPQETMQASGNTRFGMSAYGELLLVDAANNVLWRTGYQGEDGAKTGPFSLILDTQGYLVIMDGAKNKIWTSSFYSPASDYDCWNYNPY